MELDRGIDEMIDLAINLAEEEYKFNKKYFDELNNNRINSMNLMYKL